MPYSMSGDRFFVFSTFFILLIPSLGSHTPEGRGFRAESLTPKGPVAGSPRIETGQQQSREVATRLWIEALGLKV